MYTTAQILFALASEVLLKAARKFTRGRYRFIHNLDGLFTDLDPDLQERVLCEFESKAEPESLEGRPPREAFLHLLGINSEAFEKSRYAFEDPPEPGKFRTYSDVATVYEVLEAAIQPIFGPFWATEITYKAPVPAHLYEED